MALETVGVITEVLNKILGMVDAFLKTKKVRYSIEGNKIAYEYIKRVEELYHPDDKKLEAWKEKFIQLAIVQ